MTILGAVTLLPLLMLGGAGCGGESRSDAGVDHLSFEKALAYSSDTPVTVRGSLLVEGDRVRLCDGLAESYPPQCASRQLEVVSLGEVPEMEESPDGRVQWTPAPVTVMGVVSGGEIAVGHVVDEG